MIDEHKKGTVFQGWSRGRIIDGSELKLRIDQWPLRIDLIDRFLLASCDRGEDAQDIALF